jgi:hypothetical protein
MQGSGSVRKEESNYPCLFICGSVLNSRCGSAIKIYSNFPFLGSVWYSYECGSENNKKPVTFKPLSGPWWTNRYLLICGSVPNAGCGSVRKEEFNYCLLICGSVLNCRCGSAELKRVHNMFLGSFYNSYSKIDKIIKKMCSLGKTGDFWLGRHKEGPALAPEDYLGRIKNPKLKKIMSNSCIISPFMRWPMYCTESRYNFYIVNSCLEVDILAKTQSEGETDVEENILEQQRLLEEEAVTKPDEVVDR